MLAQYIQTKYLL